MLIIGELINSSRKKVREAMAARDADYIKDLAKKQSEAGAGYIDVNAGAFADKELEVLEWAIEQIRAVTDTPLCIDSPRTSAIELGVKLAGQTVMVNSITAEEEKYSELAPIVKGADASVVALCMDDSGMPEDEDAVVNVGTQLVQRLVGDGIAIDKIYIDPLIRPVSTRSDYGTIPLNAIERIKKECPGVHVVCGLSNVSFGLPKRKLINQTFVVLLLAKGLDAAIIDPLDKRMIANILATDAILGTDDFCMNYVNAEREGNLEGN